MSQTNTKTQMSPKTLIILILGFIVFLTIIQNLSVFQPKQGQIAEASFDDRRAKIEADLLEADKKIQEANIEKEIAENKLKGEELEESLKASGLENESSPNPINAILTTITNVLSSKPAPGWSEFTEYAKQNPWRGATFPEGTHLEIAKKNQSRYENIEGCHPYLLMSMHYTETGLQYNNGSNGQGAFQAYSSKIRYPANSPATDFDQQAIRACQHIRAKVGGADLSKLDDFNLIGKALALYNGCYSPGIGAFARGDYGTPRGWDKCPYTANFLTSNTGMKQCAVDGCRRHNTRQIYGTMAFIAHLKI